MSFSTARWKLGVVATAILSAPFAAVADPSEFSAPWRRADRALVVDAYEYNAIDWKALATDKRIVGFIGKASDGLPPPYSCTGNETEIRLCKALFKRHAVARELFHTRRTVAKSLGLKWGAYHLARPGNPVDQANNFIDFAQPEPDDLLAIDIEDNDPDKWMSLSDAEEFVRHVQRRTGRFPVLYTNGTTAKFIADNRELYPLLSRLPLWYARYKPEIGEHFPKGNWQSYTLWQFASQANCSDRSCPYRVPGTDTDIDVNVASMNAEELRKAWPFGGLLDVPVDLIASVPIPIGREAALAGDVTLAYAPVEKAPAAQAIDAVLHPDSAGQAPLYQAAMAVPEVQRSAFQALADYVSGLKNDVLAWFGDGPAAPVGIDPITTATIPGKVDPDETAKR
ncbi:MAG TPA: GH25 family lysozyme [Rhizobiaceae bacterium]|nr:GH25 family lysozyme [Rhizobiaceae bacterium]